MNRSGLVFVVALLIAFTISFNPQWSILSTISNNESSQNVDNPIVPDSIKNRETYFSVSDTSTEGVLDPLIIEQVGFTTSGTLSARTDTEYNTAYSMYLDDGHNWLGSRADLDVRDLTRLYVLNGTFSEGTEAGDTISPSGIADYYPYGWGANSTSGNIDQVQRVRYENTGREYIVVENKAKLTNNPQHIYTHYSGTAVNWTQTIELDSTTTDFLLSFDYLYALGPIDGTGPQSFTGNCYVEVFVDGTVIYSISLKDLALRDNWYSTGSIPISMSGLGPVDFKIGININGTFTLDADDDYDYATGADGAANAEYITVYFDDVSLTAAAPPSFEQVELQYAVEGISRPILGSNGVGSVSIPKLDYWTTDPVNMQITSNTTVSFEYEAYLLSHRFSNSTWTTVSTEEGAHYSVNLGESPQIQFNTYIGFLGEYVNLTTRAWFPSDWDNWTVYDPFFDPVTSSCNVSENMVEIPTSLMTLLGWWTFNAESPNYFKSIGIQKLNSVSSTWSTEAIYRSGNTTRAAIELGTATETPDPLDLVNVTWTLPNGTIWTEDSVSGGVSGSLNSTPHGFGTLNTSAGLWSTYVSWHNGSEVAFGATTFEIHHSTTLTPHETHIETESGQVIANFVYFTDAENGEYLMNPAASVSANWSVTTVVFGPDAIYNRWIGIFDTSLVGPGDNLVVVTANRQYYDEATCTFIVHSTFSDNELIIDNVASEVGLGNTFFVTFQYLDQYGAGITEADVSINFTGTAGGLSWIDPVNVVNGNYSVAFTAEHSGSYAITISASKDYFEESEDALFILVGEKSTNLSLENGTSAVISFGEQYRLVVRYTNGSGFGLDGASLSVLSTTPETGIDYTNATNEGSGYFSIILTPTDTGTYTLLISASLADHRTQFISFTLTATTISAQLRIAGGSTSASVGVTQPFEILVIYEQTGSTLANISSATIHVNFTSYAALIPEIISQAEGYLIRFSTNQIGLYEFSITASKTGFQSYAVPFTLFVQERAIRVEMESPVWYQRHDLNITLKLIEVDTGNPVSDAEVSFKLYRFLGVEMDGYLNETSPGIYSIFIMPQWYDGTGYSIRIFLNKTNFALDQEYDYSVLQTTRSEDAILIFLENTLPPIIGIAAVSIVSLSGRVVYIRKKKDEFAKDIANKRRFDDADNIIGVIVMHKKSGIPVYSRIVKGGFEEGIVAAFISAVTHFRQEFQMFDEEAMNVIPISDIIRAVQTRNLICAFITTRSASIEHNRKMEDYGMQVATYLDDFYTESSPTGTLDSKITEVLDYVYDETMDGNLIKFYKVAPEQQFPRRYRLIEQLFEDIESHHCSRPVRLAQGVATYGVSEAHGCTLVFEAIEKGLIKQCDEHETTIEDMTFAEFFEERNNKGAA